MKTIIVNYHCDFISANEFSVLLLYADAVLNNNSESTLFQINLFMD